MELLIILVSILAIPFLGYSLLGNKGTNAGLVAWVLTTGFIVYISFFVEAEPIMLMMLYIMSTFLSMKILMVYNHLDRGDHLSFSQWLIFCFCWFGMNPRPFLSFPSSPLAGYKDYFLNGLTRILIGLVLINAVGLAFRDLSHHPFGFIFQLICLVAISLILHFGILNISTGLLRKFGIGVTALFKDPIKSKSLSEFWSRRWNIAFVELTTIAVLRPARSKFGDRAAFWLSYIFSGLLHEMAISLPVKTGFGKPFLYFIIQAVLILTLDKSIRKIRSRFLQTFIILACLFLPIFLLFHEVFIQRIILPIAEWLTI